MRDSSENQQQEREALWPTELPTVFFLMYVDVPLFSRESNSTRLFLSLGLSVTTLNPLS